ncbi:hypothetical protein ACS0TY_022542 [Phlomoides rotata]
MEPRTNLNLLFISLFLVLSLNSARSARLAPAPQPASSPSQSPSQAPDSSQENIDLYPLAPSASEADSDDDSSSDGTTTLEIKKDDSSTATLDVKEDDSSSDSDSSSDVKKNATVDFATDLHAIEVSPELKKICDQTDHSTLCLATVLPLVKEGDKASVDSVLQVAVEAGSAFAKEALSEAKKLAEKPGTSEDLKATLKDCEDGYNTAIDNFEKTLDAFSSSDLGTMRTMLSAVISYVGDCQDQFTEMQIESPLTSYSEKLTEMASNCLAISSLEKTN